MKLKTILKGVGGAFGVAELFLIFGLGLLAVGLWWIFPPASLIVPGLILVGIAVFGVKQ